MRSVRRLAKLVPCDDGHSPVRVHVRVRGDHFDERVLRAGDSAVQHRLIWADLPACGHAKLNQHPDRELLLPVMFHGTERVFSGVDKHIREVPAWKL